MQAAALAVGTGAGAWSRAAGVPGPPVQGPNHHQTKRRIELQKVFHSILPILFNLYYSILYAICDGLCIVLCDCLS
jgi:hypothetical protein